MVQEFTDDILNQQVAALKRQLAEKQAQDISNVKGSAALRGISGSTFEATGVGAAQRAGTNALADSLTQIALDQATKAREERLIREGRAFQTSERVAGQEFGTSERIGSQAFASSERLGSQSFSASQAEANRQFQDLERQKQEAYQSGEYEKARQFEAQQNAIRRNFEASESRKNRRNALISAGLGAVGSGAGAYFGSR